MSLDTIAPEPAPSIQFPPGETCIVEAIDTTCNLTVPADTLVEPVIPGHELMNFPTIVFLITHSTNGRKVLFDLGCRKDYWNLPPPISSVIDANVPGIRVDKDLVEILTENNIDIKELEAAIVSHHHYDHIGNPATFPKKMKLIVGPGFSKAFLPGYPTVTESPVWEDAFEGRLVQEVEFRGDSSIAGFRAHNYFGDGSLYILDTPGHAVGHLSALVRTTPNTFIFLGGDICHFGGAFRPTKQIPMPSTFSAFELGNAIGDKACPCSLFTACHPNTESARTTPYYQPCFREDSWYVDPAKAQESINKMKVLDSQENVLILIAHDPSVTDLVPFFPFGTLNNWYNSQLKSQLQWRWLNELPITDKPFKPLVPGTFVNGKLVKSLDGKRVE